MPVRCANCGLLALADSARTQYQEPNDHYRETGETHPDRHAPYPVCFVNAFDLRREIDKVTEADRERYAGTRSHAAVLAVIQRDRDCERFHLWQRGHSPKEHKVMADQQQLLKWQ